MAIRSFIFDRAVSVMLSCGVEQARRGYENSSNVKKTPMSEKTDVTAANEMEIPSHPPNLKHESDADFGWEEFSRTKVFPRIDGLRAVAILLVVWHHTGGSTSSLAWLRHGYHGVTLFFAISGFLITTLLLREKERSGRISLTRFFARRSLRIFPLYFLVLGVYCIVVLVVESDSARREDFFGNLIYFLTYTSNWFVHTTEEGGTIFFCSWSLATEEQYYLVWPFVVALVSKRCALWAAFLALTLWGIAKFGISQGTGEERLPIVILQSIAPAICLGSASAIIVGTQRGFGIVSRLVRRDWAGIILLAVSAFSLGAGAHGVVMAALAAMIVVYFVVSPTPIGGRLLMKQPVAFVGAVSYGIYMWHLLCKNGVSLIWAKTVGGPVSSEMTLFLLTLGSAVFVSWLSFRFYEKPFLRLKKRFG